MDTTMELDSLQNSCYPSILQIKKLWQEDLGELSKAILPESMQTQQSSLHHKGRGCYDSQTLGRRKIDLSLGVQKHVPRQTVLVLFQKGLLRGCILLIVVSILSLLCFQGWL